MSNRPAPEKFCDLSNPSVPPALVMNVTDVALAGPPLAISSEPPEIVAPASH
jgi:hypothetical protein